MTYMKYKNVPILDNVIDFIALQPMASSCELVRGGRRYHFTMYDLDAEPMAQIITYKTQAKLIFASLPSIVTKQQIPELY